MTRKYQRYSKEFKGRDQSEPGIELFIHRRDGRIPEKRVAPVISHADSSYFIVISVYEPQLSLESYRGRVNDRPTMVEVRYSPGLIRIRRVT